MANNKDLNKKFTGKMILWVFLSVFLLCALLAMLCALVSNNKQKDIYQNEQKLSQITDELFQITHNNDDKDKDDYKDKIDNFKNQMTEINNKVYNLNKDIYWLDFGCNVAVNISVSALIFAVFDFTIKRRYEELSKDENQIKNILNGGDTNTVNEKLEKALRDYNGNNLTANVICYGTSGLNGAIDKLEDNSKISKLNIVACALDLCGKISGALDESFAREKQDLFDQINEWNDSKTTVYECKVLPTIRGIVIKNSYGNPVFCAFQPYYMNNTLKHNEHMLTADISKRRHRLTIIMDSNDAYITSLANFLDEEFDRLSKLTK